MSNVLLLALLLTTALCCGAFRAASVKPVCSPSACRGRMHTGLSVTLQYATSSPLHASSVAFDASSTAVVKDQSFESFIEEISSSMKGERFISISLSKPKGMMTRDKAIGEVVLISITGRLVNLKAGLKCQLTFKYNSNEQVKNFDIGTAATNEIANQIVSHNFSKAQLVTSSKKFTLSIAHATGVCKLAMVEEESTVPDVAALVHDRLKVRPVDTKASFLRELKVTTDSGRPLAGMADKLRQIERFVEILSGLVESTPSLSPGVRGGEPLRIFDMGSGMAYLTFAAHSYFHGRLGGAVATVGVEARAQLVDQCTAAARRLGGEFDGISFERGSIEDFVCGGRAVDVLVALHACDTATDDAIFSGITSGASVIVTSPCCHKEVRRQIDKNMAKVLSSSPSTHELLSHGLFRERSAEMVTDCLRVLCLNSAGYDTTVLEFVDGQHTAKNVMIAATKRPAGSNDAERAACRERISSLMTSYGVETQALVRLLDILNGGGVGQHRPDPGPALKPLRGRKDRSNDV